MKERLEKHIRDSHEFSQQSLASLLAEHNQSLIAKFGNLSRPLGRPPEPDEIEQVARTRTHARARTHLPEPDRASVPTCVCAFVRVAWRVCKARWQRGADRAGSRAGGSRAKPASHSSSPPAPLSRRLCATNTCWPLSTRAAADRGGAQEGHRLYVDRGTLCARAVLHACLTQHETRHQQMLHTSHGTGGAV